MEEKIKKYNLDNSKFFGILKKKDKYYIIPPENKYSNHDWKIAKIEAQKQGFVLGEDEIIIDYNPENKTFCANYERDNALLSEMERNIMNCYRSTYAPMTTKDNSPKHYDNSGGSLYDFCEKQKLNTWEFDILKRVIRCRKKGNFKEDLEKTKFLIDLYLKEYSTSEKEEDITKIIKETPNDFDLGKITRKIYGVQTTSR